MQLLYSSMKIDLYFPNKRYSQNFTLFCCHEEHPITTFFTCKLITIYYYFHFVSHSKQDITTKIITYSEMCKVPFSGNCAKVLISIYATFSCLFLLGLCINIYVARLWGMLRECTLGSSRVLCFYQHKIHNYNTCSCCTS